MSNSLFSKEYKIEDILTTTRQTRDALYKAQNELSYAYPSTIYAYTPAIYSILSLIVNLKILYNSVSDIKIDLNRLMLDNYSLIKTMSNTCIEIVIDKNILYNASNKLTIYYVINQNSTAQLTNKECTEAGLISFLHDNLIPFENNNEYIKLYPTFYFLIEIN